MRALVATSGGRQEEAVMQIRLANPRGFCAGVDRAIAIVQRALDQLPGPIYVRHEVVHNRSVVADLREQGAIFVDEVDEVPPGSTCIFSAHGVAPEVVEQARLRGLRVVDATCPLVAKVHLEVIRYAKEGRDVVLIGHADHPEVQGTLGQFDRSYGGQMHLVSTVEQAQRLQPNPGRGLAYVTQTTLSVDDTQAIIAALQQRFTHMVGPARDDICYATQNRQDAVRTLAHECDLVLVVGSVNSSNSNRLCELARSLGARAQLLDDARALRLQDFQGVTCVGVTAGASAPESRVQEVVAWLQQHGAAPPLEMPGVNESVVFSLPQILRGSHAA